MREPSFVIGALAGAVQALDPERRARLASMAGLDGAEVDRLVAQGLPVVLQGFDDLDLAGARARALRRDREIPVQVLPARTITALLLWGPVALPAASLLVILVAGAWFGAWSVGIAAAASVLIVAWVGRSLWGSLSAVRGVRRVMGPNVVR